MSAPQGGGGQKTAEELLAALLSEREHVAVLEYSRAHALESDSAVFFLVALLKMFALSYDRMLATVAAAEDGRASIEKAAGIAEQRIQAMLDSKMQMIRTIMSENTSLMGFHTGEMRSAGGELKVLKEELDRVTAEAKGTYRAYRRLADDGSGTTLSQLFQKAALGALERRVPFFDDTIRSLILHTIAREIRKLFILMGVQSVVLIVVLFLLR